MASLDEMKQEAKLRMIRLNLQPLIFDNFEDNKLTITDANGQIRELDSESDYFNVVEEMKTQNKLPYHILEDKTSYSVLFVSNEESDWPLEAEYAKQQSYMAYVTEFEYPLFAESGFITIMTSPFGIKRIG